MTEVRSNALRTIYAEEITVQGVTHGKEDSLIGQVQIQFSEDNKKSDYVSAYPRHIDWTEVEKRIRGLR